MSEGGEARNHEAEVEAVLSAVGSPECNCRSKADAALDAVRRSPQGEYPREEGDVIVIGPGCFAARDRSVLNWEGVNYVPQPSPQGEDHEEAMYEAERAYANAPTNKHYGRLEAAIAAYLSRCPSPERNDLRGA